MPSAEGRAGRQGRSSVSRQPCEKIPWRGAVSQKQTGRAVGEGSRGAAAMANVQMSGHRRSCPSRRLITPHSRAGSSRWKSELTVLRSNKKGLNKPVFLTGSLFFIFLLMKDLTLQCPVIPSVHQNTRCTTPESEGFPEVYRQQTPSFSQSGDKGNYQYIQQKHILTGSTGYSPLLQSPSGVSPWTKVNEDHPSPFCAVQLLQWGWREFLSDQPGWKPSLWFCTTTIITDNPHWN